MRRVISLLVLVIFPLVAGSITRTVTFTRDDVVFSEVEGYDVIELRGYPVLVRPGEPRLPRVVEPVLIPAGAMPVRVEVIGESWVDIPGTYKVVPAQPDVPLPMPGRTFALPEMIESDVYASVQPYPVEKIRLSGAGSMGGYRIAHVEVFPVRYIPASGVLQMATQLTYRLYYAEHRTSGLVFSERQRRVFGDAVSSLVVNPEDVVFFAPRVGRGGLVSMVPPGYYEYVVISESPLDTVFERLAQWKTKKGVPANVVDVSWISSTYSGYDLQEKIRNFIIDAYQNWGTIYVLLGGSCDYNSSGQNIVPMRKGWYTSAGGPDNDSLPSDLYYSDLDGDWDADGDHHYGEVGDSVDMYADVYVGRAVVYNVAMAQNFVYKVLTYEQNPPIDYIERLMLPTAILWSSYEERPMQDSIAKMAPSGWRIAKMYERNGTLSRQGMIDTMNVGYNLGHWEGHGDEDGIYMGSPYLTSGDADGLVNGDRVGIANAIACMCGGFDLVPAGGDCFAEHLVNREGGGLAAAIMNARYGWGAYVGGYVPGPSERIDTTFYAKLFQVGMFHLGQVHHAAKDAWVFYADSGAQYDKTRWCIYELNLFGEPEMSIWTDQPLTMSVSYPGAIQIGNQNVDVTVTSGGSPLENALVCLQKGSETYASGYTNAAGFVSLNVEPLTPGFMDITVTAKNHYPFEDSIVVQSSTYAYVMYLKCSVSDPGPGGNNNGQLNPGESVEIPLWVKNYGQSTGNNIMGSISTSDGYATLSDTLKSFGNIPADDSSFTGSDGYDLTVDGACPNGHAILFDLICDDDVDSTWLSHFSLTVYAAELKYSDHSVVGGNNNGILDPNETADLVVILENIGGADAPNVTSTLMCSSPYITINDASGNYGNINMGNTGNNSGDPYTVTADASTPSGTAVDFEIEVNSGFYTDTLPFSLTVGRMPGTIIWGPKLLPNYPAYPSSFIYGLAYDWVGDQIFVTDAYTQNLRIYSSDSNVVYYGVATPPDTISDIAYSSYDDNLWSTGYKNMKRCWKMDKSGAPWAWFTSPANDYGCGMAFDYNNGNEIWFADRRTSIGATAYIYVSDTLGNATQYTCPIQGYMNARCLAYDSLGHSYMHVNTFFNSGGTTLDSAGVYEYQGIPPAWTGNRFLVPSGWNIRGIEFDPRDGNYWLTVVQGAPAGDNAIVKVSGFYTPPVGVEEMPSEFAITESDMSLYPTIATNAVHINLQIPKGKAASIKIYDIAGRIIKHIPLSCIGIPRAMSVIWDGCDDSGRSVAAGVYFVSFETDDCRKVEKAILVR
jgi:hypothetical protein